MLNTFKVFLVLLIFPVFGSENEEIYSIYFDSNSAPGTKKLTHVNSKFYNHYLLNPRSDGDLRSVSGDELIVDISGIYLEKNKLLSISREEIRENSKYTLRDGYLHGVVENDSVMVALEGDSYYFLIPSKSYLFEVNSSQTVIYQGLSTNSFLILTKEENGYQSALYVSFSDQKISLSALDFEQKEFDYRKVTGKKDSSNKIPLYLLKPSKKEWDKIMGHFAVYDDYTIQQK